MIKIDGRKLAAKKSEELKQWIIKNNIRAKFTIIQVGNNEASNIYIRLKMKKAESIGFIPKLIKTSDNISQEDLLEIIEHEAKISNGIIVQLPINEKLDKDIILNAIPYTKDIDGLSQINQDKLYDDKKGIVPATPKAIMSMLKEYSIPLKNKKAYIVGDSNLVGKPVKKLLENEGAITKSFDKKNGIKGTEEADILIVAAGSYNLIRKENIKKGAIIIDVGINTITKDNREYIVGDVDADGVKNKAGALSPVPGGVGPMTIISLFENLKFVLIHFKV